MAAENRGADHPVVQRLIAGGKLYSFFQAVHLLQSIFPEAAPVGTQGPAENECLRFTGHLSLAFPSSDIAGIRALPRPAGAAPRFEMSTTFLGLYGPPSPLPAFYTENLLHEDSDESLVMEFLDIFHHRAISLFYRTWEKYRYPMRFQKGGADLLSRRLLSLIGLDPAILPANPRIPPVRLLAYAGLLTQQPRSASALRGLLADYFEGIEVEIEQCVERSVPIDPQDLNRLGEANADLGVSLTIGESILDRNTTFRIALGPVGLETFVSFLPPGDNTARLRELVDLFNVDGLDYEIEVRILQAEIPTLLLSSETARLGWSSWLGDRPAADQSVRFLMQGRLHAGR